MGSVSALKIGGKQDNIQRGGRGTDGSGITAWGVWKDLDSSDGAGPLFAGKVWGSRAGEPRKTAGVGGSPRAPSFGGRRQSAGGDDERKALERKGTSLGSSFSKKEWQRETKVARAEGSSQSKGTAG